MCQEPCFFSPIPITTSTPSTHSSIQFSLTSTCRAAAQTLSLCIWTTHIVRGRLQLKAPTTRLNPFSIPIPMTMTSSTLAPTSTSAPKVLGLGALCVDFIAVVEKYPQPDEKIRTKSLAVFGGGNCGNTITALARLGVRTSMLTKVGDDGNGSILMEELRRDGVDLSQLRVKNGMNSPFTYVMVDPSTATRTCIHTPAQEEYLPEEIDEGMLEGVALVHLDGRMTQAAAELARLANTKKIPVALDIEKDRPFIGNVLPRADYIITNSDYPHLFAKTAGGDDDVAGRDDSDADEMTRLKRSMIKLLESGRACVVITTLGSNGSMMVRRKVDFPEDATPTFKSARFGVHQVRESWADDPKYEFVRSGCWPIQANEIVDTTGAGDAFIGGVLYGVVHKWGAEKLLCLASRVAAEKLKKVGARQGLPYAQDILDDFT